MNRAVFVLVAIGALIIMINNVGAESDVHLEAKVSPAGTPDWHPSWYSLPDLNVTKLEIQGNSEGYKDLCPSLQCIIEYRNTSPFWKPPDTPDRNYLVANFDFRLHDDITHSEFGPKKRELVEQYSAKLVCDVNDIIEKNAQEIYYCDNESGSSIRNKFYTNESWSLVTSGIYDAKNLILKIDINVTK